MIDYLQTYTALYRGDYMIRNDPLLRYVQPMLNKERPTRLLDVGCGRGELLDWVTRQEWNEWSSGIDISEAQIRKPSQRRWAFDHGPASLLPYRDDQFGWCSCVDVLEHLELSHILMALSEMRRVSTHGLIGMVCTHADLHRCPLTGENLHQYVADAARWRSMLCDYGTISDDRRLPGRYIFTLRWNE